MRKEIEIARHVRSLDALGEAVGAMKSLAAHHVREARGAIAPSRAYREGVERIVARTGASIPAGDGGAGLLVIGAELGLCGAYDARIVELAIAKRAELGDGPTIAVGRRAGARLARRGRAADEVLAGPASVRGITDLLLRLAEDVLVRFVDVRLRSFDVVSSRFEGIGKDTPVVTRLLPLDVRPAPGELGASMRYLAPDRLAAAAVRELLYVTMHDLLLDALASEHGARLVATQSAQKWLDDTRERLRRQLVGAKREASTQEVLEIAAGARARRAR